MSKCIAIIPARFQSTRFPGKPLADIKGKPMIQHVYEKALLCKEIEDAIVATDDNRIAQVVQNFGGKVEMTSSSHQTGTDRIAEVLKKVKADIVLNIQGDEPTIHPNTLSQCVLALKNAPQADIATLKYLITKKEDVENPNIVKVVCDKNNFALYFSRHPIPYNRNNLQINYFKHIGIYAYRQDFLLKFSSLPQTIAEKCESLEQLRALENGYRIIVDLTEDHPIGIDTPEDLKKLLEGNITI